MYQPLLPHTVRQLALARYLFTMGVSQSRQPSPVNAFAVLSFHDAVEMFLHLAVVHHGIAAPKKSDFLEYWTTLVSVGPVPHKPSMDKLNRARVGFKHAGNLPSDHDLEFFRVQTEVFFEEACPLLFGPAFTEVSLVETVTFDPTREHLKKAEEFWSKGDTGNARVELAAAFFRLVGDYQSRKAYFGWSSNHFSLGDSILFSMGGMSMPFEELGPFANATGNAISALQSAVRLLAMGLDFRKHSRFAHLAPSISYTLGGVQIVDNLDDEPLSSADYLFMMEFVIESALKLQEFDYTVVGWEPLEK